LPDIDVPYVSQGDDDVGCVWASIKMVIEFYAKKYPDLPNPDVEVVKRGISYEKEGTSLDDVTGINRMLRGTTHELVFEVVEYAKFPDIEAELAQGKPVIAWIKQNRWADLEHVIVVKGVNAVDLRIYVNDPDPEEPSEHMISGFMKAWETSDRTLIRADVRLRPEQRRLDEP
jgi:hypothetical protein